MDEILEQGMELFCQDGVLLKTASANYMQYLNTSGTLSIVEYPNSNQTRFIEWKPNDITVDSDVQDQEWAVVNTVERRNRTLSTSSNPAQSSNAQRIIRINMKEIKSFRVTRFNQKLSFNDASRKPICTFVFQHGNADSLVAALKGGLLPVVPTGERNLYIVVEHPEFTRLNKSFAELNLFPEHSTDYVWTFFKNLHNRPYETTMEAFAKLTDIIYRGPDMANRLSDDIVEDLLTRSLTQMDNLDCARSSENVSQTHDEYLVVSATPHGTPSVLQSNLPPKPIIHRSQPLNEVQWKGLMDSDGRINDIDGVKMLIFRGGVENYLRKEVWKFLLNYYPWNSTFGERTDKIPKELKEQYEKMKLQWTLITPKQEENNSFYRERRSLVEKDVNRTDRTDPFYAGEDNPNLTMLFDILMTYVMYNFDLGYVQGMSDLASPILYLLEDEVEAFWCFVGFMDKVCLNFEEDQTEIKEQLASIHEILTYIEPELASYLQQNDSGNMFFCFRWLLVWFKREFNSKESLRTLWEVLWTGLPCQNFHIVICASILQKEKSNLEAQRSFAGILKYVNELSGKIDVQEALISGETLYHQIAAAGNLAPENVRVLLGLPIGTCSQNSCNSQNESTSSLDYEDGGLMEAQHSNSMEGAFDRALDMSYI